MQIELTLEDILLISQGLAQYVQTIEDKPENGKLLHDLAVLSNVIARQAMPKETKYTTH